MRRPRIDQNIAHAQLFDEPQRFFPRARADRHHPDHRADAEHDAHRGQQRPRLLRAQIAKCLAKIRKTIISAEPSSRRRLSGISDRLCLLIGIGKRHLLALVDPGDHRLALTAADQLHVLRHKALRCTDVHERPAVAFKQRLRRNPQHIIQRLRP